MNESKFEDILIKYPELIEVGSYLRVGRYLRVDEN